ncbi:hypothetical protein CcrC2_gp075 [Caulobacter phage C2]|nr:hypothetical protein CcrC2_gp075 [Caulobacter phage C2]
MKNARAGGEPETLHRLQPWLLLKPDRSPGRRPDQQSHPTGTFR